MRPFWVLFHSFHFSPQNWSHIDVCCCVLLNVEWFYYSKRIIVVVVADFRDLFSVDFRL